MATPWQAPPAWWYEDGAPVVTVEMHRHLPEAKTINYIPGITAQLEGKRRNPKAIDALYVADGMVGEGARSNTFIYSDGCWITPANGVLLGVTRAEVIKLLQADGGLEIRDITLDEYYAADEIILTSSTKEVVPVVQVDEATIGDGAPGEMTKRLMRQWRTMTDAYAGRRRRIVDILATVPAPAQNTLQPAASVRASRWFALRRRGNPVHRGEVA